MSKNLQMNVMLCCKWTYVSEEEADAEFCFGDRAWNYLQKTSDLPLNTEIIKQTHKIMMEDEKVLVGEYRKSPAFADYHTFAPSSILKNGRKTQFLGFIRLNKMIQLWPLQICLETLSIYIHLKMEMEELVA